MARLAMPQRENNKINLEHDRPHRQSPNNPEDLQVQGPVPSNSLVRPRQLAVARIHIRTRRLDVVVETLDDLRLLRDEPGKPRKDLAQFADFFFDVQRVVQPLPRVLLEHQLLPLLLLLPL